MLSRNLPGKTISHHHLRTCHATRTTPWNMAQKNTNTLTLPSIDAASQQRLVAPLPAHAHSALPPYAASTEAAIRASLHSSAHFSDQKTFHFGQFSLNPYPTRQVAPALDFASRDKLTERLSAILLSEKFIYIGFGPAKAMKIAGVTVEPLRFVAGKRLTARCTLRLQNKNTAALQSVNIIAKLFSDERKADQIYCHLSALARIFPPQQAGESSSQYRFAVHIPKPIALFRQIHTVLMDEMAGSSLKAQLSDLEVSSSMYAAGAVLANFHMAKMRVERQISECGEMARLHGRSVLIQAAIAESCPDVSAFLRTFDRVKPVKCAFPVLLHGSYKLSHIFQNEQNLALLDLDSMAMGHPAYDIANFLASLYSLGARSRVTEAMRQQIFHNFLSGYSEHALQQISAREVLWYLAVLLVTKKACKLIARTGGSSAERAHTFFALAQQTLDRCVTLQDGVALEALPACLPVISELGSPYT